MIARSTMYDYAFTEPLWLEKGDISNKHCTTCYHESRHCLQIASKQLALLIAGQYMWVCTCLVDVLNWLNMSVSTTVLCNFLCQDDSDQTMLFTALGPFMSRIDDKHQRQHTATIR